MPKQAVSTSARAPSFARRLGQELLGDHVQPRVRRRGIGLLEESASARGPGVGDVVDREPRVGAADVACQDRHGARIYILGRAPRSQRCRPARRGGRCGRRAACCRAQDVGEGGALFGAGDQEEHRRRPPAGRDRSASGGASPSAGTSTATASRSVDRQRRRCRGTATRCGRRGRARAARDRAGRGARRAQGLLVVARGGVEIGGLGLPAEDVRLAGRGPGRAASRAPCGSWTADRRAAPRARRRRRRRRASSRCRRRAWDRARAASSRPPARRETGRAPAMASAASAADARRGRLDQRVDASATTSSGRRAGAIARTLPRRAAFCRGKPW